MSGRLASTNARNDIRTRVMTNVNLERPSFGSIVYEPIKGEKSAEIIAREFGSDDRVGGTVGNNNEQRRPIVIVRESICGKNESKNDGNIRA